MKITLPTIVKVSLNAVIDCDTGAFLDLLAEAAVGSPLLMQITWRLVGSEPPHYLFIEVDGDPSAIEETPDKEEDPWLCPSCHERGEPRETLGSGKDRYYRVCCTANNSCEYEDYWHVPFTEEDYNQLSFIEVATDAEAAMAKAEHDKDSKEDR